MNNRFEEYSVGQKRREVKDLLEVREGIPLPAIIEFNIWGACNRKCGFCPVGDSDFWVNRHEGIQISNYSFVLESLASLGWSGIVLWSAFSEPFLHRNVEELVSLTKAILPESRLHINTNGDIIRRRHELITSVLDKGVDRIYISVYDGVEDSTFFSDLGISLGLTDEQWHLRRRFFNGRDYGMTISNRAGLIDSNEFRSRDDEPIISENLPLNAPCFYPSYQVVVDYDGSVLLCAHDWRKEFIAGNAFIQDFWEIWTSPELMSVRDALRVGNRSESPCSTCDVAGSLIGSDHAAVFEVGA